MPMGASMMYPYPGGMRYQAAPYVMMPSNAYMNLPPTQPISVPMVVTPRTVNDSPVAPLEGGNDNGERKPVESQITTGDTQTSNEAQDEGVSEGLDEVEHTWDHPPHSQPVGTHPLGGYTVPPNANASVYYPGGNMSVHSSQPYGHMIPPQMPPMVQGGHGGYSIVYGVPGHMGYSPMRGQPMAYSSGPYMPYGVQGMIVPGGGGSIESGAGRGGRGMVGMNNSGAGRAPRRPNGRTGNAAGRTGPTQVQGSLRNALGNNTRYYPQGTLGGDTSLSEAGLHSSDFPPTESSVMVPDPSILEE
jgi:hypothetical protein